MGPVLKFAVAVLLVFSSRSFALPVGGAAGAPTGDAAGTQLNVESSTQIPGAILKKGSYSIRIIDHLSDRLVVQVNRNGKMVSTFLALPSNDNRRSTQQGPIVLTAGKSAKSALRGFAFPDGTVADFVYPKAEAVDLAKANDMTIPAVDPASEGMSTDRAFSKTEREIITLWLLSPTPVGPNDQGPGIKAERYQPQVAAGATPVRPARPRPALAALPHTASALGLVELAGLLTVVAAAYLSGRRLMHKA